MGLKAAASLTAGGAEGRPWLPNQILGFFLFSVLVYICVRVYDFWHVCGVIFPSTWVPGTKVIR